MLCVPITAPTTESVILDMHRAAALADAIEVRLDYVRNPSLERIFAHRPALPLVATCRPATEGGHFQGSEEERIGLLEKSDRLGADYVDIELTAAQGFRRRSAKVIVSRHDFSGTPVELEPILTRLKSAGADIVKLVTTAQSITDNVRVLELLHDSEVPTVAFCMGRLGLVSRILAEKFGSVFTFGCLEAGRESAPGQPTAGELREIYRAGKTGRHSRIFGLIGNPVAHSASPAVHNAAFDATGTDAVYVPFEVEDIKEFLRTFKKLDIKGYSVTVPHKEGIIRELSSVDDMARRIGAVNTVFGKGGKLLGTNTDWEAAIAPLEEAARRELGSSEGLRGMDVVVLGAGGAARAIVFGLKHKGAKVRILNRTLDLERAVKLAEETGSEWGTLDEAVGLRPQLLINATPVGMHPRVDESPVPSSVLRSGMLVFDAVYNPAETRLMREAKARGCFTLGGMEMFVRQAVRQFEIWTGKRAPREVMQKAAEGRIFGKAKKGNIFLTGYRCTGKSVAGSRAAELLGYGFVDMDEMIEAESGMTASELFARKGEEYFRDMETAVLGRLCDGDGQVVATGGGAVLREANVDAMKRAGKVALLSARPDTVRRRMVDDGKTSELRPPLLGADALAEIEEVMAARMKTYEAAADLKVETDELPIEEVAKRIAALNRPGRS